MTEKPIYVAHEPAGPHDSKRFRRCCVSPPNLLIERGFPKRSFFMQERGEHYALMRMNRGSEPEVFGILGSYKAYEEKLLSGVALYILQAQIFALDNYLGEFRFRNWTKYDIKGAIPSVFGFVSSFPKNEGSLDDFNLALERRNRNENILMDINGFLEERRRREMAEFNWMKIF